MENKSIVTKEQALERVYNNAETIETGYGQIHVNKKFFRNCAIVSGISTGVGVALLATVGFVLVPVAVTGLGIIATGTNGAFYLGENAKLKELKEAEKINDDIYSEIITKIKRVNESAGVNSVASRSR